MSKYMEDIQRVILSGNLAADAEMKFASSGLAILNMTVVSNSNKKKGDQWESYANFYDATVFGKSAEALAQYLVKGKKVFVEGRLEQSRWENDGVKRSKVGIIVDKVILGGDPKNPDKRPMAPSADDTAEWERPYEPPEEDVSLF